MQEKTMIFCLPDKKEEYGSNTIDFPFECDGRKINLSSFEKTIKRFPIRKILLSGGEDIYFINGDRTQHIIYEILDMCKFYGKRTGLVTNYVEGISRVLFSKMLDEVIFYTNMNLSTYTIDRLMRYAEGLMDQVRMVVPPGFYDCHVQLPYDLRITLRYLTNSQKEVLENYVKENTLDDVLVMNEEKPMYYTTDNIVYYDGLFMV